MAQTDPDPIDPPVAPRRDRPAAVTAVAALGIVFGLIYLIGVPVGTYLASMTSDFPADREAGPTDDERATAGAFTTAATIFGALMGAAAILGSIGSFKLLPMARPAMNVWAAATIGFVLVGAMAMLFSDPPAATLAVAAVVLLATLAYATAVLLVYRRPEVRAAFGTDDA